MIKYIGIDPTKTKEKNKQFIDLTLIDDDDHTKKVVFESEYDSNVPQIELKISSLDTTTAGDVVIDCGVIS